MGTRPDDIGVIFPAAGRDVNLLAGQVLFGRQAGRVSTLLGSCVAITLWHPARGIGGMCHFLLPSRERPPGLARDARFGEEAVEMLVDALRRAGTQPKDYVAHLFGGADTMPDMTGKAFNIGERNIEKGWTLIDRHGFYLDGVDVGDCVPRNVVLSMTDGQVDMRRGVPMKQNPLLKVDLPRRKVA
jgi:chemotaxis protein CheD